MPILTLLTDFGHDDYYTAAVKGTVLRLIGEKGGGGRTPRDGLTLVDLCHSVSPGDIEGAAFLLAAAAPAFPAETVHLAVVDPEVGSDRRILAVRAGKTSFVAPDNGVLTPVFRAGAGLEIRAVERPDLFLDAPGATFHGRDRFAPVAAALLRGESFALLGPKIEDPVTLDTPPPRRGDDTLSGRVAHIDRFGNLVTDIPSGWLAGRFVSAEVGEPGGSGGPGGTGGTAGRLADHYAGLAAGEPAVIPGSLGTLELSLVGKSLAEGWGAERGWPVVVRLRLS